MEIFFKSCWPTRDHIGRSTRNSNPVTTSSAGGTKGCSDHRFRAPPACTAQLLTLYRHKANNQYPSKFLPALQSYCSRLSVGLVSYDGRLTLMRLDLRRKSGRAGNFSILNRIKQQKKKKKTTTTTTTQTWRADKQQLATTYTNYNYVPKRKVRLRNKEE